MSCRLDDLNCLKALWSRLKNPMGRLVSEKLSLLPGYGWETPADILSVVEDLLSGAAGMPLERLVRRCKDAWRESPFAASAIMTALEISEWLAYADSGFRFPLNAALSAQANIRRTFLRRRNASLKGGFRFLKLKIGLDVEFDIAATRALLEGLKDYDFHVSADANQAYTVGVAEGVFARA